MGMQKPPYALRSWILVVCERDVRCDEHIVPDSDAGGDEYEGTNLAVVAYHYSFLDVNVGVDLGFPSNLATVKIDVVVNLGVFRNPSLTDYGVSRTASHTAKISSA